MLKKRRITRGRRMRVKRRRTARSRSKRSTALTKKIKKVVFKAAERKAIGTFFNSTTTQPIDTFNALQLTNITNTPFAAGTLTWQYKQGQEYHLEGFNIKFMVSNAAAAEGDFPKPIFFRAMILEGKLKSAAIAPVSTTAMFRGVDLTNVAFSALTNKPQCLWYKVDPMHYTTIFDRVYKIGGNGSFDSRNIQQWVRRSTKIKSQGIQAGESQQNKTHYLLWWGYDPNSDNVTGSVYDVDYQHQTLFRDF